MKNPLMCAAVGTASSHSRLEGSTVCSRVGTGWKNTKEAMYVKRNTRARLLN